MRTAAAHYATVLTTVASLMACGSEAPPPRPDYGPVPTEFTLTRTLVEPDTTVATAWLGMPRQMKYDPRTGNLFVTDQHNLTVHELTSDGDYVRSYGHEGEGPGEYSYPHGIEILEDRLLVLSETKILVYSTSTGGLLRETRLSEPAYRFAVTTHDRVITLPGWDGALFNIVSLETGEVVQRGQTDATTPCQVMCDVTGLGPSRVAIVDALLLRVVVAEIEGEVVETLPLDQIPFVREWFDEEEKLLKQRMDRGMPLYHKLWVSEFRALSDHELMLGIIPGESGGGWYEYWVVDVETGILRRTTYDQQFFGWHSVEIPGGIAAANTSTGAVAEFRKEARRSGTDR